MNNYSSVCFFFNLYDNVSWFSHFPEHKSGTSKACKTV